LAVIQAYGDGVEPSPDRRRTGFPPSKLQELLDAVSLIASELDPQVLLSRIAQAAADLVDARYGALGVIAVDGTLAEFITVGLAREEAERIGPPPRGDGVLGQLIHHPEPLRLSAVSQHPSAVGFPPGHPPMQTFLGAPIRVGSKVFGNLYLTDKRSGEFDDQDQEVITALAAAVGISVENARLYERARRRERSSQASAQMAHSLLSGFEPESVLELVAERAGDLVGADMGVIAFRHENRLLVEVSWGTGGPSRAGLPWEGELAGVCAGSGPTVLGDPVVATVWPTAGCTTAFAVRLGDGLLVLGRVMGPAFSAEQMEDVAEFAQQASIGLELSQRRRDGERLSVFADRDRIGRDLHDLVIQRLFATGMHLQGLVGQTEEDLTRERLQQAVVDLDDTVREIRSTIYALNHDALAPGSTVRRRLLEVLAEAEHVLGFGIEVELSDALDARVPETLADELVAVLRESLSNVIRHAEASRVRVAVTAAEEAVVSVVDNGVGIPVLTGGRRSGLANLDERARLTGGACVVRRGDVSGTELVWRVPLPD
jgi:signal transduction histidine kinase